VSPPRGWAAAASPWPRALPVAGTPPPHGRRHSPWLGRRRLVAASSLVVGPSPPRGRPPPPPPGRRPPWREACRHGRGSEKTN
jgi:hypothetical protein